MPQQDDQAPATKADFRVLLDAIGQLLEWKTSVDERFEKIDERFEEVKRHFDVVAEDLRHDVMGANRDEVEVIKDKVRQHDDRLVTLEAHAGIMR